VSDAWPPADVKPAIIASLSSGDRTARRRHERMWTAKRCWYGDSLDHGVRHVRRRA
jgi:hypothetical protein